jgi:hypothetical protein
MTALSEGFSGLRSGLIGNGPSPEGSSEARIGRPAPMRHVTHFCVTFWPKKALESL